ncbi:hypothetical protein [Rhizorhapis suberifaciens]|uniref:Inner membrane protein n=1 Tax=Rhizorhapis suberifaciens TaxID=13656 RepID=A0A840HT65_9SPHN|nr:hypothetical protein [Rhizorhapis suberifaciens]MBB4641372.1 hypothetical protein [Rhizorhapis suberifaciens]
MREIEREMGGDYHTGASAKPASYSFRVMAVLLLLAFLGGLTAMAFVMSRWDRWTGQDESVPQDRPARDELASATSDRNNRPSMIEGSHGQELKARVSELEDRIARINIQAEAASGNAARAEGLLIAFAARRALDTGAALGYIEGQLRLRFGEAQPRAVATIINAAREPVTLQDLQGQLEEIAPELIGHGKSENWWADMKREVGELVIFRHAATPSPLPARRLARARHLLEAARVDAALAEVTRMPGRAAGAKWMDQARRYIEARRALDLIETAAVLEPRHLLTADRSPVAAAPVDR